MRDKFYIHPIALWRLMFPAAIAGVASAKLVFWLVDLPFPWPATLLLAAVIAPLVGLACLLQPVQAERTGLRLSSASGLRRSISWDEISASRPAKQYGLMPGYRLTLTDGKVFWIPRATCRMPQLYDWICRHAGVEHPLACAMRLPLYLAEAN